MILPLSHFLLEVTQQTAFEWSAACGVTEFEAKTTARFNINAELNVCGERRAREELESTCEPLMIV